MFRVITRRLRTATFECCGEQLPLPQWHISLRSFSSTPPPQQAAEGEGGGWVPNWMRSRLPAALGGNKEEISELEGMTLDGKTR